MNHFISDTHFGHTASIAFDKRPFSSVEEMDDVMVELWNGKVTNTDNVYILGDFTLKTSPEAANELLRKLKGMKYLIRGNHDRFVDNKLFDISLFKWVKDYHRMVENKQRLVLCHYPIAVWDCEHRGAIHLYGHVHTDGFEKHPQLKQLKNAYNACASINGFVPCTLAEIIQNNLKWVAEQEEAKEGDDSL